MNTDTTQTSIITEIRKRGFKITESQQYGELMIIKKELLKVNTEEYQRENRSKAHIDRIRKGWSWISCGTILVAHRAGDYWVMDGATRVMAAMQRDDITALPCYVFKVDSVATEAKEFIQVNDSQKNVSAATKFKAQLSIQDQAALEINKMVTESGYHVTESNELLHGIRCISLLYKCYTTDPIGTKQIWPTIVKLCTPNTIPERILGPLWWIEHYFITHNKKYLYSLTRKPHHDRLIKLKAEGVRDAAENAAKYHARGGTKIWGLGVIDALNRGYRSQLIKINQSEDNEEDEENP